MANGEMLKELRELAAAEKITTPTALRLLCSVTAEVYDKLNIVVGAQDFLKAELAMLQGDLCEHKEDDESRSAELIKDLNGKMDQVLAGITNLATDVEEIRKNPAVILGDFARKHPKWAGAIAFGIFLVFNLWFISGFRRYILILANVPPEIIEVLAPIGGGPTPTP